MSRITSKRQVTIPKAVADAYGLRPGSEIVFEPAGDSLRVWLPMRRERRQPRGRKQLKLQLFDAAVARQRAREAAAGTGQAPTAAGRGWTREELYDRGLPR